MRILFTVAAVLVSLNRRDVLETGVESVLSVAMAGRWRSPSPCSTRRPEPAPRCSPGFLGLLVVPYAFKGRHRGRSRWRCR